MKMGTMTNFTDNRNSISGYDLNNSSRSDSSESYNTDLILTRNNTVDRERNTKDFLFNELSAKKLQEFVIVKINHKGKRQNRILGIDAYNVYNDKVSNRKRNNNYKSLKGLFKSNDAKRTSRPLESVQYVQRKNNRTFVIKFKEDGKDKNITYETPTIDLCSEILAKLKYLGKEVKDLEESN